MKNYLKFLVVLLLIVLPFKVFASEVTNVFIDEDNKLSFTKADDYYVYQVYIKYGETEVSAFGHNAGGKSPSVVNYIDLGCEKDEVVCPENNIGNYTLEMVALDTANGYAPIESTRTLKTISYKHEEFNGDDYYHVDVVGNETKYTITLDPDNDIENPQPMNNLVFGKHVVLGSIESYGFTLLPKRYYFGWQFDDFNVTQNMTITPSWEPEFTMSFNFNGGTYNGEGTFVKDCVGYGPSTSLENVMHAFGGTYEVIAPNGKEIDYITINGVRYEIDPENGFMLNQDVDIVYYWKWSEGTIVHNVTFTDGFDNEIKTVEVADGQIVSQPAKPVVGKLLFSCWKLGDNCYNFTLPVTSDLTIDAYWNYHFEVEANMDGVAIFTYSGIEYADGVSSSFNYHENELFGVDQRGINGYQLVEWRLGSVDGPVISNDSSKDYYVSEGGHLKIVQTLETSNLKFIAIYSKPTVSVHFNTNGGTPIEDQNVIPGEYATKPGLYDSTKNGYLLGDWYSDPELTQVFSFNTPIETETTLYASWNVYVTEVRGTINKPVVGFSPDTNIVSLDPDKYTFAVDYWYTVGESGHLEGEDKFESGKTYEVRFTVVPKKGYGVDNNTKFYLNDENTAKYGSEVQRQISWLAVAPTVVTDFNITGIVAPVEGNKFNNNDIRLTTVGLQLTNIIWTEESTGNVLTSTDKFVLGKRYILHLLFNTSYGYVLTNGYDEYAITGAPDYLKAELVDQMDIYDMQIYYEATKKPNTKITVAPTIKVRNAENNTLLVSWKEVENAEKFTVYQSTDEKTWTTLGTTTDLSYTATGLTYGKVYYFKVKASNTTNSKTSKVVSGKTIPNKVLNLTEVSVGSDNVVLGYDKVSVSGYEVHMSTNKKDYTKKVTVKKNSILEAKVEGLSANKTYYFKVRAYKTVSGSKVYGTFSDVLTVKTTVESPKLTISMKDTTSANVKIGESKGAKLYVLELSLDGENYEVVEELDTYGTLVSPGLVIGNKYYYRVKACTSFKCSAYTEKTFTATTLKPTFTLKTKAKKVIVKVNAVEEADGYQIYMSTSKSGTYKLVKEFTSEDEVLKYVRSTTKGKTYYFKVRSYKVVDENRVYSPFSKVSKITSK